MTKNAAAFDLMEKTMKRLVALTGSVPDFVTLDPMYKLSVEARWPGQFTEYVDNLRVRASSAAHDQAGHAVSA